MGEGAAEAESGKLTVESRKPEAAPLAGAASLPENPPVSEPSTEIATALRALLAGVVDYAGLFPPARLDMATTVRNYARYLGGDDAWMLGRVIVPAGRLDEFEQAAADLLPREDGIEPWRVSGLAAPAGAPELAADLERFGAFNERHADASAGAAIVDVIELKAHTSRAVEDALDRIPETLFPYFEIPIDEDPRGLVTVLVGRDAGAKVRTGGVAADLYPSPDDLARFVLACASVGLPFKATAGLHHPLRHFSTAVGANEFGFLNALLAAVLAAQRDCRQETVTALLTETAIEAFRFDDGAVTWRDHRFTGDRITEARRTGMISFGSCSFEEPREDLRRLGLL